MSDVKILIVDDSPEMLEATARIAAKTGCEILRAATGAEAVRLAQEARPGLILLDNNLPDFDGVEVSRRLKADPRTAVIYITMLSASRIGSADKIEGMESGADDYLTQPIPPAELLARIKAMLRIVRAERALRKLVKEKEVLLSEVHHRAKNNFAVISSLLNLQAGQIADPVLRRVLENSRDRIRTMASVHEQLYKFPDASGVEMDRFLTDLAVRLRDSLAVDPGTQTLDLGLESVSLPVNQAIPCGLIVNELVTNAFKHARAESGAPSPVAVRVKISADAAGRIRLLVSDSGGRLPPEFDLGSVKSMGLSVVRILAEEQLNGTIRVRSDPVTEFEIEFARLD